MTKFKTAIAIAVGSLFAGAAFAQSNYSIEQRDRIEQERIDRGVQSGQLTSREADRLQGERAQVERMERRARADGVMTQNERARITGAQDRLGRDIYRESHDNQVARSSGRPSDRSQGWDRGNGNGWGRGNEQRGFDHGARGEQFNHREGARGERNESRYNGTAQHTSTDTHAGQSDRFAGRQANVQHASATQAQTRPTQSQASRPVTVARQGGDSGRGTH